MAHRRSPSFFKILLDPTAPHLPVPPDFVTKHLENKALKDLTVRSAKGGYEWRLKIKKIGEFFCLCDGWDSVVHDIQLDFGDFLVFRVIDKSLYKMMVYSPNGCEKDFAPKPHHVDYDSCVVEEQVLEKEDVVVDDVVDDGVEDDDDDDDDDIVVEDDDVDVVVEDDEEEEEVDDDDDDEEDDDDEDEVEYEEKDDDEDEGDDDGDGDGDGGIDGNDGDPFFMKSITKTHKSMMRLPPDFVELAGIEGEGTLIAVNVDGAEWELGVRVEKHNKKETYCLSSGWMNFRRGNDICEGDECVFKFIRNEDKLLLARVIKSRRLVRRPSGEKTANGAVKRKREGEKPANGVAKRKREQPVRKVETRAARGGGVVARGDESVKGVRRLRGTPATPAKQSRCSTPAPAKRSRGTPAPAKRSRGTPSPAKRSRGRPAPAKRSRGRPAPAKRSRGTPAPAKRSRGKPVPSKQSRGTQAKQSRGKRARRK